jgi:hypothetical protein
MRRRSGGPIEGTGVRWAAGRRSTESCGMTPVRSTTAGARRRTSCGPRSERTAPVRPVEQQPTGQMALGVSEVALQQQVVESLGARQASAGAAVTTTNRTNVRSAAIRRTGSPWHKGRGASNSETRSPQQHSGPPQQQSGSMPAFPSAPLRTPRGLHTRQAFAQFVGKVPTVSPSALLSSVAFAERCLQLTVGSTNPIEPSP